jgi:hypothetical protein
MFPRPIEQRLLRDPAAYKVALPIALFPVAAAAARGFDDLAQARSDLAAGNYFGCRRIAFWQNYADVFNILRSGNISSTRSR